VRLRQSCAVDEAGVFRRATGNPKGILVFTAFFPQVVDRDAHAASFATLGAIFLLFEFVAIVICAALGALSRGARGFKWFSSASGSSMIGFGIALAFNRRPDEVSLNRMVNRLRTNRAIYYVRLLRLTPD
jgi:hypothetical protein